MPLIKNIQFKDNWQGGPDLLSIEFQFDASELNQFFMAKIGYRRVGAGNPSEPWQAMDELVIEPKELAVIETCRPSISPNTGFQQQVQFKVILMRGVAKGESEAFPLNQ